MNDAVDKRRSVLRETPEDLKREADILDEVCQKFKCSWKKLGNGGKYRIDAVMFRGKDVKAFAEVKHYVSRLHLLMNVPKYNEGFRLAEITGKPFLFIVKHEDRVGYIKVHSGGPFADVQAEVIMGGGTPPGREPNPDDIEPLMKFNSSDVIWV